jgi:hypothetical protein
VRRNRRELAAEIRAAVLEIRDWHVETLDGGEWYCAMLGDLRIVRTTAATPSFGAPAENGIDIWAGRKVFSMWWHDGDVEDDFEIVAMAPGEWFLPLVAR